MTKSRVFRSLFQSYIAVLILPMVLCAFVFGYTAQAVNSQVQAANQETLSAMRDTLDTFFRDAYSTLAYVMTNDATLALKKVVEPAPGDTMQLRSLKSVLKQYVVQSSTIQNLLVSFRDTGILVSRDNVMNEADASVLVRSSLHMEETQWKALLEMESMRSQYLYSYRDAAGRERQQLLLLQKDNKIGSEYPGRVVAIAMVDMSALRSLLQGYARDGEHFCGIEIDGQWIDADENAGAVSLPQSSGILTLSSHFDQLRYHLIPSGGISRMIRYMTLIMAAYYAVCLGVGLLLVWRLSKKNYSPVKKLVSTLLQQTDRTDTPVQDEYLAIEKTLGDLMDQMRDSDQRMDVYRNAGRDAALRRLLNGRCGMNALEENGIYAFSFQSERFCTVLYSLESVALDVSGDENLGVDLVDFIIASIMQEVKLDGCQKFAFTQGNAIACLINLPAEPLTEENKKLLEDAKRTLTFLSERMNVVTMAAVSRVHSAKSGLQTAYFEARDTLAYMQLSGMSGQAVAFGELHSDTGIRDLELSRSLDLQHRLLQTLRDGQYTQAHHHQDLLMHLYFDDCRELSGRQINLRLSTVINGLTGALKETGADALLDPSLLKRLYHCSNIVSLQACSEQIFQKLEESPERSLAVRERDLRIIQFIQENYRDPELNLNLLADHFHLTSSYCSQLVRRSVGIGPADYIQQLRIAETKKLLSQTEKPLRQIAEEVGFGSSQNLIRAFKRHEGVTPSTYRGSGLPLRDA